MKISLDPSSSSLESQGRFQVFHAPGTPLQLEARDLPVLGVGELLIANEYTTLCRSDLNTYCGKRTEKSPTILGHEIVGRLVATGPAAPATDLRGKPLALGQRLTWGIYASDPDSALAQRGIPQKGTGLFKYGHERLTDASAFHGGLATHTQLRAHTPLVQVSEAVPLPVAALINCAVATVAASLRLAGDLRGQTVVVSGAGMLGLVACGMAQARGAAHVIAVDLSEERLALAPAFGAGATASPEEMAGYRGGAGVVLEYSGANSAMRASLDWLRIGGTAVWVGGTFPQPDLPLPAEHVIRNLLIIKGLHNYNAEDLIAAVDFVEAWHDRLPLASLVHEMPSLAEAEAAFAYALAHNPLRVGIRLGGDAGGG